MSTYGNAEEAAKKSRSAKPFTVVWVNRDTGEVGCDSHHDSYSRAAARCRTAWEVNPFHFFDVYGRNGERITDERHARRHLRSLEV